MKLSAEQNAQLKAWLEDRMTLTEIYKKVVDDWKLPMTYMELRFLIDDLGLEFLPPLPVEKKEDTAKETQELGAPELIGKVSVSIDKVVRPGALASGTVTFTDGGRAAWIIDQSSRIAIMPSKEGYKPSEEDVQEFQVVLQEAMHKSGLF